MKPSIPSRLYLPILKFCSVGAGFLVCGFVLVSFTLNPTTFVANYRSRKVALAPAGKLAFMLISFKYAII